MIRKFGTDYSGFYYPSTLKPLNSNSIIYCVGAGEDISHDIAIAKTLHSNVYIFDPTPRAIEHVELVKKVLHDSKHIIHSSTFGGGDATYWDIILENKINPDNIIFLPYGLYIKNDMMEFYQPSNDLYVSCSIIPGMKSNVSKYKVPVKTLKTIMTELNHNRIDLLKIDIEGAECDVLHSMLEDNILPHFLSVDFDVGWHGETLKNMDICLETIDTLKKYGYKIIHSDMSNYSFCLH